MAAITAHQTQVEYDYEDRIAALRAQVDRITSRQLMDQRLIEEKVNTLIAHQDALNARKPILKNMLLLKETNNTDKDLLKSKLADIINDNNHSPYILNQEETVGNRIDYKFSKLTLFLKKAEQQQNKEIELFTKKTEEMTHDIFSILEKIGLNTEFRKSSSAVGGPFLIPEEDQPLSPFEKKKFHNLDHALQEFSKIQTLLSPMPLEHPAEGKYITSGFGNRIDPFFKRIAMHSGVDFLFLKGEPVIATGNGKIIFANPSGGYGNLVEIEHGAGITTRYGHLSRILVKKGDIIKAKQIIGLAGSTGRSTATHLHYEVRIYDKAINPLEYINAGIKLRKYLNPIIQVF
ncbi:Peptidase, M23/M37 family [Liberibacter crescens BT-1]|uniref:Peptidase, M23/M37 family n=2 Tax=Liberibacter crescens TaxID=1273132 RepID=L0EU39_LIBCB|nr:Peptidase, M23/M37 family [Liberibacter crescens BT-1]